MEALFFLLFAGRNVNFYDDGCHHFNTHMFSHIFCSLLLGDENSMQNFSNNNSQDETCTVIIKTFRSHLKVEIVQTVWKASQCLWASIGEKHPESITS